VTPGHRDASPERSGDVKSDPMEMDLHPLRGLEVVELDGDIATSYAGRLLADLGARVTRLRAEDREDPVLRRGASEDGAWAVTEGALFTALNHGKELVSIPRMESADLLEMFPMADVVLAGRRTLDDDEVMNLRRANESLVVGLGSVCGEASSGPRWLPLHAAAISGVSSLVGENNRMPLPPPFEIGAYEGGVHLAGAILAACYSAHVSGHGQVVGVDVAGTLFSFMQVVSTISQVGAAGSFVRSGRRFPGSGGAYPFAIFPAADGHVACIGRSAADWQKLLTMMGNPDWAKDARFQDPVVIAREYPSEADALVTPWFRQKTRDELFSMAREAGLPLAPVKRVSEVLQDPQFNYRDSFGPEIAIGEKKVRVLQYPYQFYCSPAEKRTPSERSNQGGTELSSRLAGAAPTTGGIFSGLRVLDLSWVWSGPMVSAALADLGADVIKLENPDRLDNARLRARPLRNGVPIEGPLVEISQYFHQNNRGKRSMYLDIKDPTGAEMFRRLIRVSDVVVENLTPGVFDRAGLGYVDVAPDNPGLIWLAASAVGRGGPLAGLRAYAPIMSSLAGIEGLVGYEDDPELGMLGFGLGDANAGSHALFALLAALIGRQHDGRGRYIDMSQTEAAATILVEPLIEAQLRGADPGASGAGHPEFAPHGHYRCEGPDEWAAIAVTDDAIWRSLALVVGGADLAGDPQYATASLRHSRSAEVDQIISTWTSQQPRESVIARLGDSGVTAAPVFTVDEARAAFGDYLGTVHHPVTGDEELAPIPWELSATPRSMSRAAPLVGEHTEEIMREMLGLDDDEIGTYVGRFHVRDEAPITNSASAKT
jgi:crotonobetainyl-CoA:carnitine CoA-transferase CaiB-like acyl-CoA transferase